MGQVRVGRSIRVSAGQPQVATSKTSSSSSVETAPVKSQLGILIGAGSVGKRHAKVLEKRYQRLIVVDVNSSAREWANSELSCEVVTAESLSSVSEAVKHQATHSTAVIANWGPAHFATFEELVSLGVRRIFCEKPLAVSLKQIEGIRRSCEVHNVALTAGLHLRYRGIAEFIRNVAEQQLGGLPTSMVVDGGARCIATTGSHWLDLALSIFGDPPSAVVGTLRSAEINPRAKSLKYWDGTACWEFGGGQRLSVTYDNASSVHERVCLYSPNGVIEIASDLTVRAFQRNLDEVRADPRVIRVGQVERERPVAELVPSMDEVLSQQLDEIEGISPVRYGVAQVLTSATALVTAFESHRLGRRLNLPATREVIDQSVEWNIS
jgi:predicted dehydrogenase